MNFTTRQAIRSMLLREMQAHPKRRQVTVIIGGKVYDMRRVPAGYTLRVQRAETRVAGMY